MRIARVDVGGSAVWCTLEDGLAYRLESGPYEERPRGRLIGSVDDLTLLRPVGVESKVVCLLGNWRNREDRDGPAFFIKPASTLINPGDPIVYPELATRVVYEAEIAVVVAHRCRDVKPSEARDHILGYTCFNDITALEMKQVTNFPFLAGKSFDTFGSMGPWVETGIEPDDVALTARVNGRSTTDRRTRDMLWSTDEIVSWVTSFMTLYPGDVICCGTPPEYDDIAPGDIVEVAIEGIGTLTNSVVD